MSPCADTQKNVEKICFLECRARGTCQPSVDTSPGCRLAYNRQTRAAADANGCVAGPAGEGHAADRPRPRPRPGRLSPRPRRIGVALRVRTGDRAPPTPSGGRALPPPPPRPHWGVSGPPPPRQSAPPPVPLCAQGPRGCSVSTWRRSAGLIGTGLASRRTCRTWRASAWRSWAAARRRGCSACGSAGRRWYAPPPPALPQHKSGLRSRDVPRPRLRRPRLHSPHFLAWRFQSEGPRQSGAWVGWMPLHPSALRAVWSGSSTGANCDDGQ